MMAAIGSTSSMGIGPPGAGLEPHQAAQRAQLLRLVVDGRGVLLEDLVALGPRRVLELEHGLGVEEVELALAAPLVLATNLELAVGPLGRAGLVGPAVPSRHLGRQDARPDAADAAEVPVKYSSISVAVEADGLEDLGAGVGGHRRDAHLRHDLEHALAGRLDVVAAGPGGARRPRAAPRRSCRRWSRGRGTGSPRPPRSR